VFSGVAFGRHTGPPERLPRPARLRTPAGAPRMTLARSALATPSLSTPAPIRPRPRPPTHQPVRPGRVRGVAPQIAGRSRGFRSRRPEISLIRRGALVAWRGRIPRSTLYKYVLATSVSEERARDGHIRSIGLSVETANHC
jgi:hypothetical protein